ncbi:MAG: hypothetical protein DDT19_01667 [Syntrophomonadaceae bacterium]|nr:hypothetical protein [Bacillota bacterium]
MDSQILTIETLEKAKEEITRVGASPVSVSIIAPKAIFRVIKVTSLSATAANILKRDVSQRR